MEMITIEVMKTREEFLALKTDWNQLLSRSQFACIFMTHDWLFLWWRIYGDAHQLYILLVWQGREMVGILPLMTTTCGQKTRLEFIGTPNSDYNDLIGDRSELTWRSIIDFLNNNRRDWDIAELGQISDRSESVKALRALMPQSECPVIEKEIETCYGFHYDGPERERSAFAFRRNATLKKAFNYFKKNDGLTLTRVSEPEELQRLLPQFFHLHCMRWAGTPYPSKFMKEENRRFFIEMAKELTNSGHLCFFALQSGLLPVALLFNFEFGRTINHYTIAINPYFESRSPGILLLLEEAEYLVRQGYELDFSRGAHQYKALLANREYKNLQFTFYNGKSHYYRARLYDALKKTWPLRAIIANEKFKDLKAKGLLIVQNDGYLGLLRAAFKKFMRPLICYRCFLKFTHEGKPQFSLAPGLPVERKKLSLAELDQIATFCGAPLDSSKYHTLKERLEKKDDCFAALYQGRIVSVTWGLYHADLFAECGLVLTPQPNEVVSSDALTSPIYRGLGIRPYLMAFALEEYYARGLKIIGVVENNNKAQLASIRKLNYTCLGKIRKLRVFGIRIF